MSDETMTADDLWEQYRSNEEDAKKAEAEDLIPTGTYEGQGVDYTLSVGDREGGLYYGKPMARLRTELYGVPLQALPPDRQGHGHGGQAGQGDAGGVEDHAPQVPGAGEPRGRGEGRERARVRAGELCRCGEGVLGRRKRGGDGGGGASGAGG